MTLKELTIVQSSVETGDPHICSDSINRNSILSHIFEPLIQRSGRGLFKPCLARKWAIQPDGLTWLFQLRENVKFHNGTQLKAKDIIANLDRITDTSIGGAYGTHGVYASYLSNAKFTAKSDMVVQITTTEPMADLLDLLAEMPMGHGEELYRLPREYIGTGPYKVDSRKSDEVELKFFKSYWGKKPPVDEIIWIKETNPLTRTEMIVDRDADIGCMIGLDGKRYIEDTQRASTRELASGLCIIFIFNLLKGVCVNPEIRKAINYALDMDDVIRYAKRGAAEPLNGFLTPHHFGYDPETKPYSYDPEKARNLLRETGYPNGIKLEMDIPNSMPDEAPRLAEIMTKHYARIGVDLDVHMYYDRRSYADMVREKRIHDLCCFDSSPMSTFRVLREKLVSTYRGPWWQGYHNPEVNKLYYQATKTFEVKKRQQLYREIYRKVTEDAPWVFLYRPYNYWAIGEKAEFWAPDSDGLIKIK
jgi:peptide/nickel transport system substrate-binding protein